MLYNTRKMPGHSMKVRKGDYDIDTIIIHTCYDVFSEIKFKPENVIDWLDECGATIHFVIGRDGEVWNPVEEDLRAGHAGVSQLPFEDDKRDVGVNEYSIGIELISAPELEVTEKQYQSLFLLIEDILTRKEIKYILGHKDVTLTDNVNKKAIYDLDAEDRISYKTVPQMSREEYFELMKDEPKTDPWNFDWDKLKEFIKLKDSNIKLLEDA